MQYSTSKGCSYLKIEYRIALTYNVGRGGNVDLIKIGKYIAEKRKEMGLTQRQLAEKLGMSDKSVSKWERGDSLR